MKYTNNFFTRTNVTRTFGPYGQMVTWTSVLAWTSGHWRNGPQTYRPHTSVAWTKLTRTSVGATSPPPTKNWKCRWGLIWILGNLKLFKLMFENERKRILATLMYFSINSFFIFFNPSLTHYSFLFILIRLKSSLKSKVFSLLKLWTQSCKKSYPGI